MNFFIISLLILSCHSEPDYNPEPNYVAEPDYTLEQDYSYESENNVKRLFEPSSVNHNRSILQPNPNIQPQLMTII